MRAKIRQIVEASYTTIMPNLVTSECVQRQGWPLLQVHKSLGQSHAMVNPLPLLATIPG